MAGKTKKISSLIESQLPEFITSEYGQFSLVVQKYYEQLELQGQPLDIIHNITKYRDINQYENTLLNQYTELVSNADSTDTTVIVKDGSSFPKSNGYIRIGTEICFYKECAKQTFGSNWEFREVSRGVSGNTTLGDLYEKSTFVSTEAQDHYVGDVVYNVSNLFLYAFVKNFESDYLDPFPEKYLKKEIDKRTLIKNIKKFYSAKGTDKSIKFLFNSIVSQDPTNIPEVYNPKDYTLKASTSDWITKYSLKVKSLTGDLSGLIGERITQTVPTFASAVVDNVIYIGDYAGEQLYELILEPSSINSTFTINPKTQLEKALPSAYDAGSRIDVVSTFGWKTKGSLLIGSEKITFDDKNVNQFIIESRVGPKVTHNKGTVVYDYTPVTTNNLSFIVLGVLYNLNVDKAAPYSSKGDKIEISSPGFDTRDPIIYDVLNNNYRWKINETNTSPSIPLNLALQSQISNLNADVSAIYEDEQYYYICSSGYPSHQILKQGITVELKDQKFLRLIRKYPTTVTEVYSTKDRDVGIFVDGTVAMGYKDEDYVNFGKITKINITNKGSGYKSAPFVLINNLPNKAEANLTGEVVESITVKTDEIFNSIPSVTITSGRNAVVSAVVTKGKITSLKIVNQGEYYSSPPIIRITDASGRGKFAEYKAIISFDGKLVDFEKIDEGKFYTQGSVLVEVIPEGYDAEATAEIVKWVKNRYEKLNLNLDDSYGYVFKNIDENKKYGYGRVANPVRLRQSLNDNLTNTFQETNTLSHSPILGFAYDGNPIYGPYGYSDPTDSGSSIVRLQSGYVKNTTRPNGPSISQYPLGTFIDDYTWTPSIQIGKTILDQNNGRFCVTPEYPNGTYAYFVTINSTNQPVFPYIIGENYYSLPVDSNYNSLISQDDLPNNVKRLKSANLNYNGSGVIASIEDVTNGSISSIDIKDSPKSFNVGNKLVFNNLGTGGSGASAFVSEVTGENVSSINSKGTIVKIDIIENAYLFANDFIRQQTTNAVGKIVGNVFNEKTIVLEQVSGTFNLQNKLICKDASNNNVNVINLILDQNSSYTKDAIISLTDGLNTPTSVIATGQVLESSTNQNSVKLKVLTGTFVIDNEYFLRSSDLNNTPGSKIFSISSLSQNLTPFLVDNNFALATTTSNHRLAVGDKITVDISPDDNLTETLYYVRKRAYQKIVLLPFNFSAKLTDTGIGRLELLNSGKEYNNGTYQNVELVFLNQNNSRIGIGKPEDLNNAKATIQVSNGKIISFTITNKGKTYKKGDILTIKDDALFNVGLSTPAIFSVDHAGLSASETTVKLTTVNQLSEDDTLQIGNEIIKITDVDLSTNTITVQRGVENTVAADHYDRQEVKIYNARYRFNQDYYPLENGQNDPSVFDFNSTTNVLNVKYSYSASNPTAIVLSNVFYDNSTPRKQVNISEVFPVQNKLEFAKTTPNNFVVNPIIEVQKYYSYKFDTSHSSMVGTYLDFSPSLNQNIFVSEKIIGSNEPGTASAYVKIKFGFGSLIESNTLTNKQDLNFNNYYYFIVANNVDTNNSYLKVIDDPLAGEKTIQYATENKFVYSVDKEPQYQGSGDITYKTNSSFALGKISKVTIDNSGSSYTNVPLIDGVLVSSVKEAKVEPIYDSVNKKIVSVRVVNGGENYTNPKIAIVNSNDYGARFKVYQENGKIKKVDVINTGFGFEYLPELKVYEGAVKLYAYSNDIGIPKNVKFINNGGGFYQDNSVLSTYRSAYTLLISNFDEYAFSQGEEIVQKRFVDGVFVETVKARVAKNGFRPGSNLLKVENIEGEFDTSLLIIGKSGNKTAKIDAILFTNFSPDIRGYSDNIGYYGSDKGKISSGTQKITDSYFYQDYSYVIKSKTAIDVWRDLIKQTTHPAGFKLFGEVNVESTGDIETSTYQKSPERISIINLEPKSVKFIGTKQNITETILSLNNTNIERGVGSVSVDAFNNAETLSTTIKLDAPFNGYYDSDTSSILGRTTFTVLNTKTNTPIQIYNEQQLIISIDGVIQEPGVAYTTQNNQITFASPPLGERVIEGQLVPAQDFFGKSLKFKSNDLNNRYLKKIRNIFQRSGIWLDAANQIRFNKNFIVEETIGYVKQKYPLIKWNRVQDKCSRDIGYVLDALEHDLRFGGNSKTINYAELYFNSQNELNFIDEELEETIDAFEYAVNLCIAAIKNWDITFINDGLNNPVTITANSNIVTVPTTAGIAVGMYISSGKQFPIGTKVVNIISNNQVELNNAAFADIGDIYSPLQITSGQTYTVPANVTQEVGTITAEGTLVVSLGGVISSRASITSVSQITFYFSKINTGTFYDAAELIENNKSYIQEETIGKIKNDYPDLEIPNDNKCIRDLGYYIDAVVYHLKYGGNNKIVEFGKTYYDNNQLRYINNELEESLKAYEYATDLMILAMRNNLPPGTYTDIEVFENDDVLQDIEIPACQEVESTLNSYYSAIETILTVGKNLVPVSPENSQKSGNWTGLLAYSNFDLLPYTPIFNSECQEVVSSLLSLYDGIETVLIDGVNSVEKSLPDYFNGENKIFDLYYEDGSIVKTDVNENLIVSLNGVIQKFDITSSESNSYTILRSPNAGITDKIVFTSAPKWDQNLNALTIQEASAVEKFFAFSIGSYDLYTIRKDLIEYIGKGPYSIISQKDGKIKSIDDENYALVFIDGVLQKQKTSYTINGSSIVFTEALNYYISESGEKIYPRVDIILTYGRDIGKVITFYDFEPDTYYNKIELRVDGSNTFDEFKRWYNFIGNPYSQNIDPVVFQLINNSVKIIGKIRGYEIIDNDRWKLIISGNNVIINETSSIYLGTNNNFDLTNSFEINNDLIVTSGEVFTVPANETFYYGVVTVNQTGTLVVEGTLASSTFELNYARDEEGNRILRRDLPLWLYETDLGDKTWRKNSHNYANLIEGDLIQIDGENSYRQITKLPEIVKSKQFNPGEQISNNIYGKALATNYNDIVRGEGLNITATIANGSINGLLWNRRDLNLYFNNGVLLQPSAYQYYAPPIIEFIPVNENGGGAKAEVIVIGGEIVDIVITDKGSGYTEPPKVVVARGYNKIRRYDRKIDTVRLINVQPNVIDSYSNLTVSGSINILGGISDVTSITSELVATPIKFDRIIQNIINPTVNQFEQDTITQVISITTPKVNINSIASLNRFFINKIESRHNLISSSTIQSVNRQIVKFREITTEVIIENAANTVSGLGAFLDIGLSATDTIVYIPNTSGFPDTGNLLIGKEIVYYAGKLPDRFINVLRGQYGTEATTHNAGDYLRLISDTISVISAPVINIHSETIITNTINTSVQLNRTIATRVNDIQSFDLSSDLNVEIDSETGFTDESSVNLNKYEAYTLGTNIKVYENSAFTENGLANVSGDYIENFNLYYPTMTIEEFEINNTSYSNGIKFLSALHSIQEYGTTLNGNITSSDNVITVFNTGGFPSAGKLYIGNEVVYYTGKTTTTFTGITRGEKGTQAQNHTSGQYIRSLI